MVYPSVTKFPTKLSSMKFSTHEIFPSLCSTVYICSNLDRQRFVTLFRYLCPMAIDSALDPQHPLSQAVPCVMARKVNREEKHDQKKTEPVPLVSALSSRHHQHGCHSRISIVAVLQYWPPKCLCRCGSLSHGLGPNHPSTDGF